MKTSLREEITEIMRIRHGHCLCNICSGVSYHEDVANRIIQAFSDRLPEKMDYIENTDWIKTDGQREYYNQRKDGFNQAIDSVHELLGEKKEECTCCENCAIIAGPCNLDCPIHAKKEEKLPPKLTRKQAEEAVEKMNATFDKQELLNKEDKPELPEKLRIAYVESEGAYINDKPVELIEYKLAKYQNALIDYLKARE